LAARSQSEDLQHDSEISQLRQQVAEIHQHLAVALPAEKRNLNMAIYSACSQPGRNFRSSEIEDSG